MKPDLPYKLAAHYLQIRVGRRAAWLGCEVEGAGLAELAPLHQSRGVKAAHHDNADFRLRRQRR